MKISPSVLHPHQSLARIVAVEDVAPGHFRFTLHAPEIAQQARAGQFVHILPREALSFDPLLRRAFSIMATRVDEIDILFRVEGNGTARIANHRVGEALDVLGPLGQPFDLQLFHVKQQSACGAMKPILMGGGVGVPPMVFLGKTLKEMKMEPLMLIGARSTREILAVSDFEELHIEVRIATDDGSAGHAGRVTELLEAELNEIRLRGDCDAVIYACGPLPMLAAVASVAARFAVPCQVSLEENMPCGIGVCNGCVVAMKSNTFTVAERQEETETEIIPPAQVPISDYGRYKRICVSGPALWANEIDWEAI